MNLESHSGKVLDMRAAVLHGVRKLRVQEVETPKVGPEEVSIKVGACGVCTTDLHMYKGEFPVKTPVILGHEFSGTVVDVGGSVKDLNVGERVAVNPIIPCGLCPPCKEGRNNLCDDPLVIGGAGEVLINGGFAEYAVVPRKVAVRIPDDMPFTAGAAVEPLGCAIHGIDLSRIEVANTVAIIGAGPMGLLLLQLARLRGASKIVVSEPMEERRKLALNLGADVVVNPETEDLAKRVKELTEGRGVDIAIEAVGLTATVKETLGIVKKGGLVTIFGVPPRHAAMEVIPFDIYFREIEVVGTYAVTDDTFRRAIDLLASKRISIEPIVTDRLSLDELEKAFSMMEERKGLKKQIVTF